MIFAFGLLANVGSGLILSLKKECPVYAPIGSILGGIVMEFSRIHSFCKFANRGIFCRGKKCNFVDESYTTVSEQT